MLPSVPCCSSCSAAVCALLLLPCKSDACKQFFNPECIPKHEGLVQVADVKPKRPNWGMLSSGEVHSTTIAAWGHLVLLGDADGNLNKWDTTTSVFYLSQCI